MNLFKNISLLQRYDLCIDIHFPLGELPNNSWQIRRVIIRLDTNKMIELFDQLNVLAISLQTKFPKKLIYIQCHQANFHVNEFLHLLSSDNLESKLSHCVTFANSLTLQTFLEKHTFIKIRQPNQPFPKIVLNKKFPIYGVVIVLALSSFFLIGVFTIIFNRNTQSLAQVKELSQQLIQIANDKKLTELQKFQLFQDYYFFFDNFFATSYFLDLYDCSTLINQYAVFIVYPDTKAIWPANTKSS